jgi:thioredoxin-dependent peroxiredoxin
MLEGRAGVGRATTERLGERRMAEERRGEAFELDERLTVVGSTLKPGQQAPDFVLDYRDPADGSNRQVRLSDSAGKVRLLNVVNSLDTPICHAETRRWEELRAELPPDVRLYTISMDLPSGVARWQTTEDVRHEALSAHRSEQFGRDYGVLIKEWRLLQRAVFVIDRDGRVAYAEYVNDQMLEPDYDAAIEAARRAAA